MRRMKAKSSDAIGLPRGAIRRITAPVRNFLAVESASGIVLLICTAVALALANSPLAKDVHDFWEMPVELSFATWSLKLSLHHVVNDGLMTLFFFVVGLEIKRELVAGELSTPQKAAFPVIAALGGMIAPAGLYFALQYGTPGESGWGIPMATDIAFVVGVLAVFGPRVPFSLKVFLLSLAIADDIGAILVIAIAYSGTPNWLALGAATLGFSLCYTLNRLGVRTIGIYLLVGIGIWFAVLKSGIHPTIAGVLLGLLTPASAWISTPTLQNALSTAFGRVTDGSIDHDDLQHLVFASREATSPLERLVHILHPWVGFIVMPLFAFANAGVPLRLSDVRDPVAIAVAIGLVIGKPLGIVGFCFLAVKLGIARLPTGMNWKLLAAAGCLGGIGFTMSLFIAELALQVQLLDAGKFGILLGSGISAAVGSGFMVWGLRGLKPTKA